MSIIIRNLTYAHPDKELLFSNLTLSINPGEKIALTGKNGCGKSTLMRILAGELSPSSGTATLAHPFYYIPQHFGQYDSFSVAQVMKIDERIEALHAILNGDTSEKNFTCLNDDWTIEERAKAALRVWDIENVSLTRPMDGLSGGEKTRIFLAGLELHNPSVILMDEPTNHLDTMGRKNLCEYIKRTQATLLVISHDRDLLNLLPAICELSQSEIKYYGGNYDFFKEQKGIQINALQQKIEEKQTALRLAKKTAREMAEQKAKQNVRGEKTNLKKSVPPIAMHYLRDKAEKSTTKLNDVHAEKSEKLMEDLRKLRSNMPVNDKLKTDFAGSDLHSGKILVTAKEINFRYPGNEANLWTNPLSIQLRSGDRFTIKGNNGSGKTTLLKLITGELEPVEGTLERAAFSYVYLDQEYSLIDNGLTVLEQTEAYNRRRLPDHEVKTILNRYLFPVHTWDKQCRELSGGEKMRLAFCCLMIANNTPDIFILDEPTNNLDLDSIEIITATIRDFTGTVLAVSHDRLFLSEINCEKELVTE